MFIIEVPFFNLEQIYNSNQAPRWLKLKENKYIVIYKDKAIAVEQKKQRLILGCSEEEFYNIWFDYFDLKTDYYAINNQIKGISKKFKVPCNRGQGLHVLRQDKFEMYVYCKLVQKVGWKEAKELMIRIAATYGIHHKNSMGDAGRVFWYEWPQPERLLEKLSKEKESSGKVKPFLKKLCDAIINKGFDITKTDNELFRLFGMHENIFPAFEIEETIRKNFNCTPKEFADNYLNDVEALTYVYILYHIKNPPKKIKEATSNGVS